MPSIVIRRDGKPAREVALEKDLTLIGQRSDADISIEDPEAIAERASIMRIGEDYVLNELCPANATQVNGQAVKKHILRDRDLITIGEYRMTFQDKRELEKPLGVDAELSELAELNARIAGIGRDENSLDPLTAAPSKKTELVTYVVIGIAAVAMSYWGYQSYVEREAREAQAAAAQAAQAKAEAARREAERPRDITREIMAPTQPAAQAPDGKPTP